MQRRDNFKLNEKAEIILGQISMRLAASFLKIR